MGFTKLIHEETATVSSVAATPRRSCSEVVARLRDVLHVLSTFWVEKQMHDSRSTTALAISSGRRIPATFASTNARDFTFISLTFLFESHREMEATPSSPTSSTSMATSPCRSSLVLGVIDEVGDAASGSLGNFLGNVEISPSAHLPWMVQGGGRAGEGGVGQLSGCFGIAAGAGALPFAGVGTGCVSFAGGAKL